MAKKKQKKEKEKFEYSNEIIGVVLILFSIIGMLGYGRAGNFIRSFSVFLVGVAYFPLLLSFLVLGINLIIKRSSPKVISRESIGLYLIIIAVLTLIHMNYVKKIESAELVRETFKTIMLAFKSPDIIKECGGGMLGAIFAFAFNWAFSIDGIIIAVITLTIIGLILLFNTSILNWINGLKIKGKTREKDDDDDEEEEEEEKKEEELEDKRIVISSIEELTNKKEEKVEEVDADIPIKKDSSEKTEEKNDTP